MIEQDVNDQYIYKYPTLYRAGQQGAYFKFSVFWRWIIFSLWHGAVIYYGSVMGLEGPTDRTGLTQTHWYTSCIAFTVVIHTIMLKAFMECVFWNWVQTGTVIFCVSLYYLSVVALNSPMVSFAMQPEMTWEFYNIFQSVKAWIVMLGLPLVALIPDLTYLLLMRVFYPSPTDYVMLQQ